MATIDEPIHASDLNGGAIVRWLVRTGSSVREDQLIAEFAVYPDPKMRPIITPLRSPAAGTLIFPVPEAGSQTLAVIRVCTHPMLFAGSLCAVCGVDVTRLPRRTRAILEARHAVSTHSQRYSSAHKAQSTASTQEDSGLPANSSWAAVGGEEQHTTPVTLPGMTRFHVQHGFEIALTDAHAEAADAAYATRLRSAGKLSLILDLDHTLIHATHDAHVKEHHLSTIRNLSSFGVTAEGECVSNDAQSSDIVTIADPLLTYRIKLRPRVREFLLAAAELYELGVDTAGTRTYAQAVVRILDPDGSLIGPRIVSRTDSKLRHKQSSAWLHRALKDDSMVVIVDDTEVVWRGARNLLLVEPYHFWPVYASETNNAAGTSVTDSGRAANSVGSHTVSPLPSRAAMPPVALAEASATADTPFFTPSPSVDSTGENTSIRGCTAATGEAVTAHTPMNTPVMDTSEETHPYLFDILQVLRAVHAEYYAKCPTREETSGNSVTRVPPMQLPSAPRTDAIITRLQKQVLQDVCIVFSGVFPRNIAASKTALWRRAAAFGASFADSVSATSLTRALLTDETENTTASDNCAHSLPPIVTHLVVRQQQGGVTAKVADAVRTGDVRVVNLSWLEESLKRYTRQPESEHTLPGLEHAAFVDNSHRVASLRRAVAGTAASAPSSLGRVADSARGIAANDDYTSKMDPRTEEILEASSSECYEGMISRVSSGVDLVRQSDGDAHPPHDGDNASDATGASQGDWLDDLEAGSSEISTSSHSEAERRTGDSEESCENNFSRKRARTTDT